MSCALEPRCRTAVHCGRAVCACLCLLDSEPFASLIETYPTPKPGPVDSFSGPTSQSNCNLGVLLEAPLSVAAFAQDLRALSFPSDLSDPPLTKFMQGQAAATSWDSCYVCFLPAREQLSGVTFLRTPLHCAKDTKHKDVQAPSCGTGTLWGEQTVRCTRLNSYRVPEP